MTDSAGGRLRAARPFSFPTFLRLAVPLAAALLAAPAQAQDSASLASKSIAQVYAVQNRVFAVAEDGRSFSQLELFKSPAGVTTGDWPWNGGIEGGAAWSNSLLLHANYWPPGDDSSRVARVTSLRFNGSFRGGDSLLFRDRLDSAGASALADGARLTALAVRDTVEGQPAMAVLGFGRLGVAYAALADEASDSLFVDDTVNFVAFPAASDSTLDLHACRWNSLCRVDTVSGVPPLDSVTAIAIDSSHADSIWVLVATQKGLRRGLWGSGHFPYVTLPNMDAAGAPVRSVFTSPSRALLWAFTGSRYFFSDDHGASFRVPPDDIPGISVQPSSLSGYSPDRPPHAAFYGDTTFINFNFDAPGLVAFRRDTILAGEGTGFGQILLDAEDGLEIERGEGALTALTVARGLNPAQAVLVVGSTLKGVFFRRLDREEDFTNINRLKTLKGSLGEVITYPTLLTESRVCGDAHVRIGYRIKKDARVTITVYNYAMEKVRVVVKNAPRRGGVARSENIGEDRWDGCDERGRFVSVGTYYILVESDKGEKAFGKALVTRGRK